MQDAVLYFYHHITVVNVKDAAFETICQVRNLTNLDYFEMESRIFDCVDDDDVEGLKLLMDYPNIFQIEDTSGHTILQRAITNKRFAVFDFLLSLDGCPINAHNSKGTTALDIAIPNANFYTEVDEHFAYSLLKKGANFDCVHDGPLLHKALRNECFIVAQYLMEIGAGLNCCDKDGYTPLCMLPELHQRICVVDVDVDELLAMMLYFGADPLIPDPEGCTPIDFAFQREYLSEEMQEHLVFYLFDDYGMDYDIPFHNLIDLLRSDPPFLPQVLKHIISVNMDENLIVDHLGYFFIDLFTMKAEYLKLLLEKFGYVIQDIIEATLEYRPEGDGDFWTDIFTENFHLLLQSQFSSDIIQIINETQIVTLVVISHPPEITLSELFELILVMLSYGAIIYDVDIELIYEFFGDCEFFRTLLYMDIKTTNENRQCDNVMSSLLYNIHMDIETFLNNPQNYKCSEDAVKHLLNYFAHPKLKNYCYSLQRGDINAKIQDLPSVPLLVELARNEVRKFLIQKYKIENSMQFYTLIKRLPISKIHQKIITLETKLY